MPEGIGLGEVSFIYVLSLQFPPHPNSSAVSICYFQSTGALIFFFLLRYLSGNASFSLRRTNQALENNMRVGGLVVGPEPSPVDLNMSICVLGVVSTSY